MPLRLRPKKAKVCLKTKKMTNISQTQAGFKANSRRNPLWISRLFNAKSSCACRNRLNFRLFRYTPGVAFFCFAQPQRRRVCVQQLLLGAGLRILQKLHGLHTGAEQLKVHGLVIRHGAHPPCVPVGSLPRSLRPDTPERFRHENQLLKFVPEQKPSPRGGKVDANAVSRRMRGNRPIAAACLRPHQSPAVTASPDRGKPFFGKTISVFFRRHRLTFDMRSL